MEIKELIDDLYEERYEMRKAMSELQSDLDFYLDADKTYEALRKYLSLTTKGRELLSRFDRENRNEE